MEDWKNDGDIYACIIKPKTLIHGKTVVKLFDAIDKAVKWLSENGDESMAIRHFVGGKQSGTDVLYADLVNNEWEKCK